MDWSELDADAAIGRLESSRDGLSESEARRRLEEHGSNRLDETRGPGVARVLWSQFASALIALLLVAAGLSWWLGETADAIAILAIVLLNAALGFSQDLRAERAMAALERLAVPTVRVRRDGEVVERPATDLAPGDVVLLDAGARVPADARVLESADLQVSEAALTGESDPVTKVAGALDERPEALGDRRNELFMGTVVTRGRGEAIVTATGMATELGHVAHLLESVRRAPTPLQRRLGTFGRRIALVSLGLVALVYAVGVGSGEEPRLVLLTALSLAVAAVPEGLPAVATVCLALGGRRLLAREALIRKLPAVETLGSVTVICSDKTGTITQNRMACRALVVGGERLALEDDALRGPDDDALHGAGDDALRGAGDDALRGSGDDAPRGRQGEALCRERPALGLLLSTAALCNDAGVGPDGDGEATGDPTEAALARAARSFGLLRSELEREAPRVDEAPFTSERQRMATLHRVGREGALAASLEELAPALGPPAASRATGDGSLVVLVKGSVESVLARSTHVVSGAGVEALDDAGRERVASEQEALAGDGLRVLGFALRVLPAGEWHESHGSAEDLENELVFLGLAGLVDPPRPGVADAVARCRAAGIRPVMITGDHPATARAVARWVGIDVEGGVATGAELARASDEELAAICERVSVHARVAPEQKLRLVEALRRGGAVVAMTGDGVNDAPALKRADIGVAMGVTGTDVSKEAGDMVLLDDDFTTIVDAVEEGRVIHDNVHSFIRYTLTSNAGEVWVMLCGPLLGMPLALLPLQVLWVNLVTDGLPGLALAAEPGGRDVMSRPPRPMSESFLGRGVVAYIAWVSVLMGAVSLGAGAWAFSRGVPEAEWRTMIFTVLTLSQLGHVLAIRSARESLRSLGLFSNPFLLATVAITAAVQLALPYWQPARELLHLAPLAAADLAVACGLSVVVLAAVELAKLVARRRTAAAPG